MYLFLLKMSMIDIQNNQTKCIILLYYIYVLSTYRRTRLTQPKIHQIAVLHLLIKIVKVQLFKLMRRFHKI